MTIRVLRVGTRASRLALWQTERICAVLASAGVRTEQHEIRTTGDVVLDLPLSRIGDRALFTKQIDDAMLAGHIDLAVHSLKDLPTRLPAGIVLAAIGERADPRDALVGRGALAWSELPARAAVATSSLRRRAQLLRMRPDLSITDVRGNVDTRVARLDSTPSLNAIVLAAAGLERLGLEGRIGERLPLDWMLPAPGQGALAITARSDDEETCRVVRAAHHAGTALTVAAERAFLRTLEGGCQVPVAAFAELVGDRLRLRGRVISLDGASSVDGALEGTLDHSVYSADTLGVRLAEQLLGEGAAEVLAQVRAKAHAAEGRGA